MKPLIINYPESQIVYWSQLENEELSKGDSLKKYWEKHCINGRRKCCVEGCGGLLEAGTCVVIDNGNAQYIIPTCNSCDSIIKARSKTNPCLKTVVVPGVYFVSAP